MWPDFKTECKAKLSVAGRFAGRFSALCVLTSFPSAEPSVGAFFTIPRTKTSIPSFPVPFFGALEEQGRDQSHTRPPLGTLGSQKKRDTQGKQALGSQNKRDTQAKQIVLIGTTLPEKRGKARKSKESRPSAAGACRRVL